MVFGARCVGGVLTIIDPGGLRQAAGPAPSGHLFRYAPEENGCEQVVAVRGPDRGATERVHGESP